MKQNKLLLIAVLFVSGMLLLLSRTHVFDERPVKAVFSERKVERILPQAPLLAQPFERVYQYIAAQFAP